MCTLALRNVSCQGWKVCPLNMWAVEAWLLLWFLLKLLFCQSSGQCCQCKAGGHRWVQRYIFLLLRRKLNMERHFWTHFVWKVMGGRGKRAIINILCYQNIPSFLRSFSFYGASVKSKGPTFDHSALWHKLAIPSFPVLISRVSSYKVIMRRKKKNTRGSWDVVPWPEGVLPKGLKFLNFFWQPTYIGLFVPFFSLIKWWKNI